MNRVSFIYHPDYCCDIGEHVFRTEKYGLLYNRLCSEGLLQEDDVLRPAPPDRHELELVHTEDYIDDLLAGRRTTRTRSSEMPLSPEIARSFILGAGGTVLACRSAIKAHTAALNLAGGFHHAYPDHAEGFCYINDVALGIRAMQSENLTQRPLIIDCDLHQGNGTAYIFRDDPAVYTLSIHQEKLYPPKEKSDLDIPLPDMCSGGKYIDKLQRGLNTAFDNHNPDFVLYVAGADPYQKDMLGSLMLTLKDLRTRDDVVIRQCKDHSVPMAVVLAGGYAPDVSDTVEIHFQTTLSLIEQWSAN